MELAELTTLRLGGPAGRLVEARTDDEVVAAVRDAALVLAGGSNVVVADDGVPGTVVRIATRGVELVDAGVPLRAGSADAATPPGVGSADAATPLGAGPADAATRLIVAAGESWDDLVGLTVGEGLQGFECLSGIPGSVGATPIQNVGAYGQEVAETIESVRVYDRETDRVVDVPAAECGFGYRTSVFRYRDRHVVLSVTFRLRRSDHSGRLHYAELARTLGVAVGGTAPLLAVREAVLALRRGKGMVIDPADPDSVSAGSFFTNPILDHADHEALIARAGPGLSPPAWPEPDGRVKISAAWLIERAGFHRGHGNGRVGISTKHTLALVNRGGASTAELMSLAREIAGGVEDRFGVSLHPEPVLVGHAW